MNGVGLYKLKSLVNITEEAAFEIGITLHVGITTKSFPKESFLYYL